MNRNYLPYIDGLRAIAVLSVIAFHINSAWLPSGFVGVDMFFVISGFIVSYSVAHRKYLSFTSYLADFYSRRIKRIFPALIFVILITAFFTALFIPNSWLSAVNYSTGLFALFGLSNFILLQNDRDYFGATTEFNPYTHTWSLGIEEQFYVLFPFLFYAWVSVKSKKKNTFILFAIAFSVSIVLSLTLNHEQPLKAYFLPYSRLWELALGALSYQLIYFLHLKGKSSWLEQNKNSIPLLAIGLIIYGLLFTPVANFPLPGAIVITAGTALLILSLYFQNSSHWLITFLSLKPINNIGKISYSLYLWHWPIFVLFRWTVGLEGTVNIAIALLLTFMMATISYFLVEKSIRINQRIKSIPNLITILIGLGFIAVSYQIYDVINKKTFLISQSTVTQNSHSWYPASLLSSYQSTDLQFDSCSTVNTTNHLDNITSYEIASSCQLNKNQSNHFYAVGDSHTLAYSTLFLELAIRTSSKATIYPNAGCPFLRLDETDSDTEANANIEANRQSCLRQNQITLNRLKAQLQPGDVLFLSSLRQPRVADQWVYFGWNQAFFNQSSQAARATLLGEAIEQLRPLSEKGVRIVFEAPKPIFPAPAYRCSDWFNKKNPICAAGLEVKKSVLLPYRQPIINSMKAIQKQLDHIYIWDSLPLLCPDDTCKAVPDEGVLFFDGDHISALGSQLLSPDFAAFMAPLLMTDQPVDRDFELTETVAFNQKKPTDVLIHTKGLSGTESWGRWSDAKLNPEIELYFAADLPSHFSLELEVQGYGSNSGQKAMLYIGRQQLDFVIPEGLGKVQIQVENPDLDSVIRIVPPYPTAVSATDQRELGIGFISMKITPIPLVTTD